MGILWVNVMCSSSTAAGPEREHALCLAVLEPQPLMDELLAKGATHGGPREACTNVQGQVRSFYGYDPDGIIQFDSGLNAG